MSTISQNLIRLETAKNNIANAISNKGVTVPSGSGFEDFSSLIDDIPTGSPVTYGEFLNRLVTGVTCSFGCYLIYDDKVYIIVNGYRDRTYRDYGSYFTTGNFDARLAYYIQNYNLVTYFGRENSLSINSTCGYAYDSANNGYNFTYGSGGAYYGPTFAVFIYSKP